jgi:DNA-directed RNA polymerase subunit M/transcription elongation factor TFIIS
MYRNQGETALRLYIKSEKNVKVLERYINRISYNQEEYKLLIQEVINSKNNNISCKEILQGLKDGKYLRNDSYYNNVRYEIEEHDKFLIKPFEVDEGVLECGKCNSNKTISYTKQTRSGDESTTVFAMCFNCNSKWKI